MEELPSQEKLISFEDIASQKGYSPKRCFKNEYDNVSHLLKAKGKNGKPIEIRFAPVILIEIVPHIFYLAVRGELLSMFHL